MSAQSDPNNFAADLMQAQRDLSTTYGFFQNTYILARSQLSGILFNVQRQVIESFLDAYALAKEIEANTTVSLAEFPNNACVNTVRTRWGISIRRYGFQLSSCLRQAQNLLYPTSQYLNVQSVSSQRTTNEVMNLGVSQLGQLQSFTSPATDIPFNINRSLRDFFFRVQRYLDEQEDFIRGVVADQDEIVRGLIDCDQVTIAQFTYEGINILNRAAAC